MRRTRILLSAQRDLNSIALYIARESGSRSTAEHFARALRARCYKIAALPGTLGRARPEFGEGLRSMVYENYLIFFCYTERTVDIITILESHRDLVAFFGEGEEDGSS